MAAPVECPRRARAPIVALLLLLLTTVVAAEPPPDIEVFTRAGCPHCAEASRFLEELAQSRPGLRIVARDVAADPAALADLYALARRHGVTRVGVPAFHVGESFVVGFGGGANTGELLRSLLDREAAEEGIDLPWLGRIRADDVGLPAFTVVVGLLDGFNPCAMWVLLLVLSLLVNVRGRVRMAAIGGTFVAVSGIAYFAFMAAWLNVFLLIGISRASEIVLGLVSLGVGLVGLRDALTPGARATFAIPEQTKPGIYSRIRGVVVAKSLPAAIAGSAVLAVAVNVVELACTAGLPLLYTRILTLRELPRGSFYAYLALYNAAYVADDSAMLTIAVVTLSRRKLQERAGRRLKLAGALVMLALGAALLAAPQWLYRGH